MTDNYRKTKQFRQIHLLINTFKIMKIKSFAIAALAATVAFASCSKEEGNGGGLPAEGKEMFVKISKPSESVNVRSIGLPSGTTTVNFETGTIIFALEGGQIVKLVDIIADQQDSDPENFKVTVADLEAGVILGKINSQTKHCYLYANEGGVDVAGKATVGANISALQAEAWDFDDINLADVADVPLYGYGPVSLATEQSQEVLKASFKVAPVSARVQVEQTEGTDKVKSYKLTGIFVNNYYASMKANLAFAANSINDNGQLPATYTGSGGTYSTHTNMRDYAAAGIGFSDDQLVYTAEDRDGVEPEDQTVFGYNVFPNYSPLTSTQLPHVIIRLEDVVVSTYNEGDDIWEDKNWGTRFLTIVGYTGTTLGNISNFEGGMSYTLKNVKFDQTNLGEFPYTGKEIPGFVEIEVVDWDNEDVGGIFG